jgi:16S rRNA (uracil1498-N3)-methyltransferase
VIAVLRNSSAHVVVDSLVVPVLDEHDAHHLFRVLRLRDGASVTATDGVGSWVECRVVGRDRLEVVGEPHVEPVPSSRVGVAFVPVKAQRPEDTLRHLVEIGVDDIIVLQPTKRAVAGTRDRLVERAARIVREACMQSRRVYLPEIFLGLELGKVVAGKVVAGKVVAGKVVAQASVAVADPEAAPLDHDVSILVVGPEGGFDSGEIPDTCPKVSIGPAVLRAETAALVAGARLVALREARGRDRQ